MTTRDHDTDPSTPGAKKAPVGSSPALAPVGLEDEPGLKAARLRPTTDPGIAPPAEMLPIPDEPMGIVVPAAGPKPNDSVDVLLDGMGAGGGPPERPKPIAQTQGQSQGQAAAAYHAEHSLAPGRTEPAEEAKVVLARPILAETIKLERPAVPVFDADPKAWADTTAVMSQPVAPRVFIAIGAGVLVVVGVFFALQRISGFPGVGAPTPSVTSSAAAAVGVAVGTGTGVAAGAGAGMGVGAGAATGTSAASAGAPATATASATAMAAEAKSNAEVAPAASVSLADRPAPSATTRKTTSPKTAPRTRSRPSTSSPKPAGADLGEFKGSF